MDLGALDRRSLALIGDVLSGAGPADLDRPTPCTGWTLADLLRHQISENHGFATAARTGSAPDWHLGASADDLFAGYRASVDDFLAAFAEPDVLARRMTIREFGTFPGAVAATMHLLDTVVHGWDFARTLDVPYAPDPDAVRTSLAMAERIPDDAESRASGQSFAPAIDDRDAGGELARLLLLLGRDPEWRPPA